MTRRARSQAGAARSAILAAALDTYRESGPRAFTMAAAARRARLTTPALYKHFASKDALLGELVQQGFDLFTTYLSRGLSGSAPLDRLLLTGGAYFDFAVDHPGHYETLFMTAAIPGLRRFPKDFDRGRSASFQILVDRVRECVDAGVLAKGDPQDIALAMWVHVHGFMSLYLAGRFGGTRAETRAAYDRAVQRLLKGLAA